MKWFMGLSGLTSTISHYSDMVKVAVYTAQLNTQLIPYFIYDGNENDDLIIWLKSRGVNVIIRESYYKSELKKIALNTGKNHILTIGSGAFLRCEIPDIMNEYGFKDKYVLYTDCDVMFLKDVKNSLLKTKCDFFAVAPEISYNDYNHINTGVMLMNVVNLKRKETNFKKFVLKNLVSFVNNAWDQTAYIDYYKTNIWKYQYNKWDKLPQDFNFKPYWGDYDNANIIHFHGPKPFMMQALKDGNGEKVLMDLTNQSYFNLCEIWNKYFFEITNKTKVDCDKI